MMILYLLTSILINIETRNLNLIGDSGQSFGLMQIRPATAKWILTKNKIKHPENIKKWLMIEQNNVIMGKLILLYLLSSNVKFEAFINSYNTGNFTKLKYDKNHIYYKKFIKEAGFLKLTLFQIIFYLKKDFMVFLF